MNIPADDAQYVTGVHEVLWGIILVALTLTLHAFGMLLTLRANHALKARFELKQSLLLGITIIVATSWLIILTHLLEVFIWAGFFLWKGALQNGNASLCYYFALMDYTTLGCNYNLRLNWRLLEGMIAIAGLLTFAWSTGVLLTVAQEFQDRHLSAVKPRRGHREARPVSPSAAETEVTNWP
jgi:hypothetical protein